MGNLTVPEIKLGGRAAKGTSGSKKNVGPALTVRRSRSLEGVLLLCPHDANGRVAGWMKENRGLEKIHTKSDLEPPEPTQGGLVVPMGTVGPGVSLVNDTHAFQHEKR